MVKLIVVGFLAMLAFAVVFYVLPVLTLGTHVVNSLP